MLPIMRAAVLRSPLQRNLLLTTKTTLTPLNARLAAGKHISPVHHFSIRAIHQQSQQHTQNSNTEASTGKDTRSFVEKYNAALDDLGVSKNLKIVLLVVLSIFGTMETWFYCKAIYIWYKGGKVEGEDKS